jgi:restriction system protein
MEWAETPRDKSFATQVFRMPTIYEIPEEKFHALTEGPVEAAVESAGIEEGVQNQTEFLLEKYLEDFIVSNFDVIFKKRLVLYSDPVEGIVGQQYQTDVGPIDILAQDPRTNSFAVIELKKGRESDRVVGQVLRYMGWVAEHLCKQGQEVQGVIICKEPDEKLKYALKMAKNVSVKYYKIDFRLEDQP